ncbi:hypothetical protein V8G54_016175 [Vigna mungo]|uniref:Uncharacterized protein n=1 Tax=Vigna mungo TaxID=3915 RepID=A0AAQ3NKP7_VIGMU
MKYYKHSLKAELWKLILTSIRTFIPKNVHVIVHTNIYLEKVFQVKIFCCVISWDHSLGSFTNAGCKKEKTHVRGKLSPAYVLYCNFGLKRTIANNKYTIQRGYS